MKFDRVQEWLLLLFVHMRSSISAPQIMLVSMEVQMSSLRNTPVLEPCRQVIHKVGVCLGKRGILVLLQYKMVWDFPVQSLGPPPGNSQPALTRSFDRSHTLAPRSPRCHTCSKRASETVVTAPKSHKYITLNFNSN